MKAAAQRGWCSDTFGRFGTAPLSSAAVAATAAVGKVLGWLPHPRPCRYCALPDAEGA
jgi:hypothetical protein